MSTLRYLFEHFYASREQAVATAIQTGLVAIDANVMLAPYRFQAGARDELFGALEKLGDRLWIPYQVGLEFHRNRLNVMHGQQEYFSKTEQEFNAAFDGLREKVRAFRSRMAITEAQVSQVEDTIQELQQLLGTVMNWASDGSLYISDHASDTVLARLETLLGNRVGEPMESRELEEARKEAKRRAEAGIPPGYKDKNKPDPTGDYLVWVQLKAEAKKQKRPVVLVTDDRKEDWYRREHGLTFGARWELREEMAAEAGVPFIIMTTETFLHHAEKYLNAEVSEETLTQAKGLPLAEKPDEIISLPARSLSPELARGLHRALVYYDLCLQHTGSLSDPATIIDRQVLGTLAHTITGRPETTPGNIQALQMARNIIEPLKGLLETGAITTGQAREALADIVERYAAEADQGNASPI
jgi:hypothetical protein